MRAVSLSIPGPVAGFLRETIRGAGGREVLFFGRVTWDDAGERAELTELDVIARGHQGAVAAIYEGADEWDLVIHNHPSGELEPSDADLSVAHELGNRSVGFAIIDNDASRHYLVVAPFRRERRRPVDPAEVEWILGPDGPLARELPGYEVRQGQVDMALEVTRAFNDKRVALCEAGTGIGKSFAYLVPAILWSTANRERVVISTGTIQLQEQLVSKDLPFLARTLEVPFEYALAKGRGNYACRRKIADLPAEFAHTPPPSDELAELEELIAWSKRTDDGSRSDLPATPRTDVWERVMSETDKSLKVNCPFYQDCFFYRAKRLASRAHILVVNHHLFFSDLAVRRESGNFKYDLVLPGYSRVVFDEAHHLEDTCSDHFSLGASRRGLRVMLSRMLSPDGRRGRLPILTKELRSLGDAAAAEELDSSYVRRFPAIAERTDEQFEEIGFVIDSTAPPTRDATRSDAGGVRIRYRAQDLEAASFWEAIVDRVRRLRGDLALLAGLNDRAIRILEASGLTDEQRARLLLDPQAFKRRLDAFISGLERFCELEDDSLVRWVESEYPPDGRAGHVVRITAAPIRVGELLASSLFRPLDAVVLTSATLSVDGDSRFLSDRLGVDRLFEDEVSFRDFPSPFPFDENVLTIVPRDLPDPSSSAFQDRLPAVVFDILRATKGRAFVLFTSYSLLRRTYDRLARPLLALGIRSLAQGEAPRSTLLERFRDGGDNVLFGTDSFWEGVDVKGRALECVIITRLPFRVPTDPVNAARVEELEARGLQPFSHYTVPQAVLRFKQGFGRLVRSTTDRGVVAILDPRVVTKSYGKIFLRSLPRTRLEVGPTAELVRIVEGFFRAPA